MHNRALSVGLVIMAMVIVLPVMAQVTPTPRRALVGAKLQACQAREAAIKRRADNVTRLGTTIFTVFDTIAQRVQAYYDLTVVPSGQQVSNYNALIQDITRKKATVITALTTAQTSAAAFSCTGDDPKGTLTEFRTAMQEVKQALKAYRTAVRALLVAVHSVTATPTVSPTP